MASIIADEDVDFCKRLGEHGLALVRDIHNRKAGGTVNILTHCNAGACIQVLIVVRPGAQLLQSIDCRLAGFR
jgi:methylthioribose-1-phosphate isomerase